MKPARSIAILALVALVGLLCCEGNEPEELPPFVHADFYEILQGDAAEFTLVDGQWLDDYGDAAFYGLAFYAWRAAQSGDATHAATRDAAYAYNLDVVQNADLLTGDVNEIAMATLGLIDYMAATGDQSAGDAVNALIDNIDVMLKLVGYYVSRTLIPGYAVETYGPTSISGLVGLVNLQHAYLVADSHQADYVAWTQDLLEAIDDNAFNGSHYDFGDDRPGLFLYPNVTMILLHVRLYQLTGDPQYLARAEALYDAIGELRVKDDPGPGMVRYKSPYSAEHMGATTDDYSTLSSQNYTLFALLLLYEVTGRKALMREYNAILEFLSTAIYGDWCRSDLSFAPCEPACTGADVCLDGTCLEDHCSRGVLHHLMDGEVAVPEDPEFFCSGCNLQLLYVMMYRQRNITE